MRCDYKVIIDDNRIFGSVYINDGYLYIKDDESNTKYKTSNINGIIFKNGDGNYYKIKYLLYTSIDGVEGIDAIIITKDNKMVYLSNLDYLSINKHKILNIEMDDVGLYTFIALKFKFDENSYIVYAEAYGGYYVFHDN